MYRDVLLYLVDCRAVVYDYSYRTAYVPQHERVAQLDTGKQYVAYRAAKIRSYVDVCHDLVQRDASIQRVAMETEYPDPNEHTVAYSLFHGLKDCPTTRPCFTLLLFYGLVPKRAIAAARKSRD